MELSSPGAKLATPAARHPPPLSSSPWDWMDPQPRRGSWGLAGVGLPSAQTFVKRKLVILELVTGPIKKLR